MSSKNATGPQVDQNREDDGQFANAVGVTAQGHKADNPCGAFVSWWDGEYEGNCELPEGHKGPHYDGISCFDNEGEEVELKSRPLPAVLASVGYYKAGKPYQVQNVVLDNSNHHIIDLQPEPGIAIRVEVHS